MKRRTLTLLSLMVVIGAAVPRAQTSLTVTPQQDEAPTRGFVIGTVDVPMLLVAITFGDGGTHVWQEDGNYMPPFDVFLTHEYNCPGVYQVEIISYDGTAYRSQVSQIAVDVPTPLPVTAHVAGTTVSLTTSDYIKAFMADRARVDWGDGSPLEVFNWVEGGGVYDGPSHVYTAAGEYVITVTNEYISPQCGLSQGATMTVTIANPTALERSTWGRLKSLYR